MVVVDDVGVGMGHGAVVVRVAVRFGALPAFVFVAVVLVVNVRMLMVE